MWPGYLFITLLLSLYRIIIYCETNEPGNRNNGVDGIKDTAKIYFKGKKELLRKPASNDTSTIVMLPSAWKDVSIDF